MKRLTAILATLLCFVLCTSCEEETVNEWQRFYGFTKDDIIGHYEANPDESLYEELPTEGVVVYDNAVIDVINQSDDLVSIRVTIPSVLNKVFFGTIYYSESNSNLVFTNGNEDLRMTVYKNSLNQVRFHGRVKRYYYDADQVLVDSDNYGFDVIKVDE